jgi:predicted extracellular nuclease
MSRGIFTAVVAFAMVFLSVPLSATPAAAAGTVSLAALGVAYAQNFDTLANTGTANTALPTGWDLAESGTSSRNNAAYAASTGSDNAGDVYSFGAAGNTERAFGMVQSGSLLPTIGASFTNDTGVTVTTLSISYTGEQWRLGTSGRGSDRLDFQYSLDATSLSTGTWINVDALDFSGPVTDGTVGALNGNLGSNRVAISAQVQSLAIATGATVWIRWTDFNASGADDGLAVDEFSLRPSEADTPPSITTTSPLSGATGVPVASNVTITFSEPVGVTAAAFSIDCANTGAHGAVLSGGPTTYTLDPSIDFGANETCTVTVFAAQVSDQDTNDPPDTMSGDAVFSFTTTSEVCGAPATFIHEAQGSGLSTPIAGSVRSVEGIVVGDYQGTGQFGGYYVQEEDADADADPATSEGIFVFNTATAVSLGDTVRVRGTVTEFSNLTQLSSATSVLICSTGNAVTPTSATLPVSSLAFWERYEGMRIRIAQELTVTETFTLGRFGEVVLSVNGRLDNPTNVEEPGAPAIALQNLNDRSRIVLDDGNNQQNIDPTFYPQGGLSASNTLRVGDSLPSVTGVLDQRFGVYRIQPVDTSAIAFTHTNPRPLAPDSVGGNLRVSAFNVLNYFNGNGLGGGFPTARGASSPFEFDRQRDKIISAMTALDAHVIGLMELENDATGSSAIEDLVAGLNAGTGPGTYAFIDTGVVGTDAIRVGILYQPAVVTPVGDYAILDSTVDPRFIDNLNRPAIAQTFDLVSTGGRFTVVVNHLKSKGSSCDAVGDPDIGDGQGNCNLTRTAAAEALVDWLASDPTGSGDPDVLVIGDLNAYAKEDPIQVFEGAGYVNAIDAFLGDHAYSFVFQGQSGYLDHALASPSLAGQVAGVTEWHVNADEPVVLDYNTEFKTANQVNTFYDDGPYRSSDHDPLLVGLNLNASPTVDAGGPYVVVEGGSVIVTASGNDPDGGTLAFAWDLNNDGTFETIGQNATFSAAGLQAPAQRTIRVRATDAGGLTATDAAVVNVIFGFSGFLPPVESSPALNEVRAGSAVPIKFSLGGDQGLAILAAGSPVSMPLPCAAGASADPIQETEMPGNAVLTYDASTDTYTYVWKTLKTWSGCRRFTLTLADGTVRFADFKFN